jgi:hypothetical protein
VPLLAIVFTAWLQVTLLHRSEYLPWLVVVVVAAAVVAGSALVALAVFPEWRLRGTVAAVALGVAAAGFLAAPAAWSESTQKAAVNGVFPGAGPTYFAAGLGRPGFGPPGGGFSGGTADVDAALAYVQSHGAATRFPLIVSSEQEAAQYVIAGKPVSSLGGFTGRETVLTNAYLSSLLEKGEARYFLLGGQGGIGPGGSANAAVSTIESVCTEVPSSTWGGSGSAATLYDCAGAQP